MSEIRATEARPIVRLVELREFLGALVDYQHTGDTNQDPSPAPTRRHEC